MNLILDIDGTLWNTTEVVAIAWNDAIESVGLNDRYGRMVTAEILQKEFGKPMDAIIESLFPDMEPDKRIEFSTCCQKLEQEQVRNNTKDLTYSNVCETLYKLHENINLFIVSNCLDGYIPIVLNKIGISDLITDYECFGVTGLSKTENIHLLMKRNSLSYDQTYYIGDTSGDYFAATKAGLPFIYAEYGFGLMPPDYNGITITDFSELLNIFQ